MLRERIPLNQFLPFLCIQNEMPIVHQLCSENHFRNPAQRPCPVENDDILRVRQIRTDILDRKRMWIASRVIVLLEQPFRIGWISSKTNYYNMDMRLSARLALPRKSSMR